ncbi:hypothetical protein PMAYCL1PPCAC_13225, partial [Pristionchus mayeri]
SFSSAAAPIQSQVMRPQHEASPSSPISTAFFFDPNRAFVPRADLTFDSNSAQVIGVSRIPSGATVTDID